MTRIIGDVVDHSGRTMSGTLTMTPQSGVARVLRVRMGLIYPTEVPAGAYEVTGAVRSVGDLTSTVLPLWNVNVSGATHDLSTKAPKPATAGATSLSINEVEPGVYQVTGATVTETQPGEYSLTV